jgi:hypothetical protein
MHRAPTQANPGTDLSKPKNRAEESVCGLRKRPSAAKAAGNFRELRHD